MTCDIVSALDAMIVTLSDAFQARSAPNFATLVRGLLLCLGRPTVTNLARAAGEANPERPSRLHRFFSRAVWDPEHLARETVALGDRGPPHVHAPGGQGPLTENVAQAELLEDEEAHLAQVGLVSVDGRRVRHGSLLAE